MTKEELKSKWTVYTECWKFFRRFSEPCDADEFWEELVKAKDELQEQMDSPLFRGIMLETVKEIERIWKEEKADGEQKASDGARTQADTPK